MFKTVTQKKTNKNSVRQQNKPGSNKDLKINLNSFSFLAG